MVGLGSFVARPALRATNLLLFLPLSPGCLSKFHLFGLANKQKVLGFFPLQSTKYQKFIDNSVKGHSEIQSQEALKLC